MNEAIKHIIKYYEEIEKRGERLSKQDRLHLEQCKRIIENFEETKEKRKKQ